MKCTVSPGEFLSGRLDELGVTATELARQIDVPPNRISQIINGKRAITGDTAVRLAHWFRTTPEFWLSLQAATDIQHALEDIGVSINSLPTAPGEERNRKSTGSMEHRKRRHKEPRVR